MLKSNNETKLNGKLNKMIKLPNPGLRSYFDLVDKGQPDEYRTTFYRSKTPSEILSGWMPQLETLSGKWPSLMEFESDLAAKVGPMSVMKPLSERMADIDSYYDSILLESKPIPDTAIADVVKEWTKARGLRIRSQRKTVDVMKKSTNSGAPYFTRRRRVVDKSYPCTVKGDTADSIQVLPDSEWNNVAILGWRGQEGGPETSDVKQRVVWMFPFSVNIMELQCYQPLIEAAQRFDLVPAWISMDAVDKRITLLFDTKAPNDVIVCTDFSKFDQHFNPVCAEGAKKILAQILSDDSESRYWLDHVYPIKYWIPLVCNWGTLKSGQHGMASGSGGTNADETLLHMALQYEVAASCNQTLNPNSMCLGDDGILTFPNITAKDVTQVYTAHGLEMNISKQYESAHDCTYLRRWHHKDYRVNGICVGVYSTCRALGRLAEQERFYDPEEWGSKMVALRQLSIIENCKYHPLFEEFVHYCMKGDKFRLGIDIPGFLDNIESIAKEATDNMPDFLGYTKSMQKDAEAGISNWRVVKYLKSLA